MGFGRKNIRATLGLKEQNFRDLRFRSKPVHPWGRHGGDSGRVGETGILFGLCFRYRVKLKLVYIHDTNLRKKTPEETHYGVANAMALAAGS